MKNLVKISKNEERGMKRSKSTIKKLFEHFYIYFIEKNRMIQLKTCFLHVFDDLFGRLVNQIELFIL